MSAFFSLVISCATLPAGFKKVEKPPYLAALEKVVLKECHMDHPGGNFSATLSSAGIPEVDMDAIWKSQSLLHTDFSAEISDPMGESILAFQITEEHKFVLRGEANKRSGTNLASLFEVISTIGPKNLRGLVCGLHLVTEGQSVLERQNIGLVPAFFVMSDLKSSKGTMHIETVVTGSLVRSEIPLQSDGYIVGMSLLTIGGLRPQEIGRLEWEGIMRNGGIKPKRMSFTSSSDGFKLFFSDFD